VGQACATKDLNAGNSVFARTGGLIRSGEVWTSDIHDRNKYIAPVAGGDCGGWISGGRVIGCTGNKFLRLQVKQRTVDKGQKEQRPPQKS